MNAERFDDAVRRLQGALTRRAALGALLGAAALALGADEAGPALVQARQEAGQAGQEAG